jgi:multidrug efflux pump subunit AcrA (membrane-fusion protein)
VFEARAAREQQQKQLAVFEARAAREQQQKQLVEARAAREQQQKQLAVFEARAAEQPFRGVQRVSARSRQKTGATTQQISCIGCLPFGRKRARKQVVPSPTQIKKMIDDSNASIEALRDLQDRITAALPGSPEGELRRLRGMLRVRITIQNLDKKADDLLAETDRVLADKDATPETLSRACRHLKEMPPRYRKAVEARVRKIQGRLRQTKS